MAITRRKDKGFKLMMDNLSEAHGNSLEFGIFGDKARRSANGSKADNLAYRYKIHEEGRGNNPKVPTLIPALQDSLNNDPFVQAFLAIELDTKKLEDNAKKAGLRISANVQKYIVDVKTPAKKPETIAQAKRRYGGTRSNRLIQTSEMKNSVNFRYKK